MDSSCHLRNPAVGNEHNLGSLLLSTALTIGPRLTLRPSCTIEVCMFMTRNELPLIVVEANLYVNDANQEESPTKSSLPI